MDSSPPSPIPSEQAASPTTKACMAYSPYRAAWVHYQEGANLALGEYQDDFATALLENAGETVYLSDLMPLALHLKEDASNTATPSDWAIYQQPWFLYVAHPTCKTYPESYLLDYLETYQSCPQTGNDDSLTHPIPLSPLWDLLKDHCNFEDGTIHVPKNIQSLLLELQLNLDDDLGNGCSRTYLFTPEAVIPRVAKTSGIITAILCTLGFATWSAVTALMLVPIALTSYFFVFNLIAHGLSQFKEFTAKMEKGLKALDAWTQKRTTKRALHAFFLHLCLWASVLHVMSLGALLTIMWYSLAKIGAFKYAVVFLACEISSIIALIALLPTVLMITGHLLPAPYLNLTTWLHPKATDNRKVANKRLTQKMLTALLTLVAASIGAAAIITLIQATSIYYNMLVTRLLYCAVAPIFIFAAIGQQRIYQRLLTTQQYSVIDKLLLRHCLTGLFIAALCAVSLVGILPPLQVASVATCGLLLSQLGHTSSYYIRNFFYLSNTVEFIYFPPSLPKPLHSGTPPPKQPSAMHDQTPSAKPPPIELFKRRRSVSGPPDLPVPRSSQESTPAGSPTATSPRSEPLPTPAQPPKKA